MRKSLTYKDNFERNRKEIKTFDIYLIVCQEVKWDKENRFKINIIRWNLIQNYNQNKTFL